VIGYPLGLAVWFSVTDAQVGEAGHFIGLAKYQYLLHQVTYADALRNTALVAVLCASFADVYARGLGAA